MNFRNRKLLITIRTLTGLFFIFSGVGGFLSISDPALKGIPAEMIPMMRVLISTGIFHMIKATEIVAGLMLVTGFLPALAAIFLAPICVGVIIVNSQIAPAALPLGFIVSALDAYLGYAYWDKYKALFARKS